MRKISVALLGCIVVGCVSTPPTKTEAIVLTGSEWVADSLNIEAQLKEVRPTIAFGDSLELTGFAGCNRFFGEYALSGDTLNVNVVGSTMMSCPDDRLESQFLAVMSQIAFCELTNDSTLIVKDMNMDFIGKFLKK